MIAGRGFALICDTAQKACDHVEIRMIAGFLSLYEQVRHADVVTCAIV